MMAIPIDPSMAMMILHRISIIYYGGGYNILNDNYPNNMNDHELVSTDSNVRCKKIFLLNRITQIIGYWFIK